MNWTNFVTYGDSYQEAFETLCNQLFERYLRRTYTDQLVKFRVINGAGGDGGIEAYAKLSDGKLIAVQSKWFRDTLEKSNEIRQIRDSVTTAMSLRPQIKEYVVCIPRDLSSLKFGRGAEGGGPKPILNFEEKTIEEFTDEIENLYPNLTLRWWFEHDIELQLREHENEGIHKFWFEKELISFQHLVNQFETQRAGWLNSRYVPELHAQGIIQQGYHQLIYHEAYKNRLIAKLQHETILLSTAVDLADKFAGTLPEGNLKKALQEISQSIKMDLKAIDDTAWAITKGYNCLPVHTVNMLTIPRDTLDDLADIAANNEQLPLQERLIDALNKLTFFNLSNFYAEVQTDALQKGKLFLGDAGTGKTHGLSNTVDTQLEEKAPAIIIRAKGTPCQNWTTILLSALEISGWDKDEILSALETLALRNDHRLASAALPGFETEGTTKVVLCIDGLEEDTAHWDDWYARIRESLPLMSRHPQVKFIFSARTNFLRKSEMPGSPYFQVIVLPKEGDVHVLEVIDKYFSKEYYDIIVEPKSLIRGIDTLLSLRLFCDEYRGRRLTNADMIATSEKVLLNKKVDRMNKEFLSLHHREGISVRTPVSEALQILADHFYAATTIEHNELHDLLKPVVGRYLNDGQIDLLIEYIGANGLLTKNEESVNSGVLMQIRVIYQLPYQSIMELVMGAKFATAIGEGELTAIPEFLVQTSEPDEVTEPEQNLALVNKRIVQNIANALFYDYGNLIGSNEYLTAGLNGSQVADFQLGVLIKATAELAADYREAVQEQFFADYKIRHSLFRGLIYPAADSAANYFGAEFLHQLLSQQPSAFAREQFWLGWDRYSIADLPKSESVQFIFHSLQRVIDPDDDNPLKLSPYSLHNERPLIFGWALATLDQNFRHRLRVALTDWALKQPKEYVLLIQKLFVVADPQIQEDLASITLGVAGKLKQKDAIGELAFWALETVFAHPFQYRDIIVKQGFRAIVERAFQHGLISAEAVKSARPQRRRKIQFLPLDQAVLAEPHEQIYPIVHDLAWYVINKAYGDFPIHDLLDERKQNAAKLIMVDSVFDTDNRGVSPHTWAMAAGIAYIKSLGFDRTKGNGHTQATHGSKSDIFTLEEKYTWLAVHYLQGYLADYLPVKYENTFVEDYSEIVDIPNPAEFIYDLNQTVPFGTHDQFVLQATLVQEIEPGDNIEEAIRQGVIREPEINFGQWIRFQAKDFISASSSNDTLLALSNYTSLHDSAAYVHSRLELRACIIEIEQIAEFREIMLVNGPHVYFAEDVGRMQADPKTDIYSNPSDLVWMSWIKERNISETFVGNDEEPHNILYGVTSVTNHTINGEREVKIPSKAIRELLQIIEMDGQVFVDKNNHVMAVLHAVSRQNDNRQDITLAQEKEIRAKLEENGLALVWFAEILTSKNALNERVKSDRHPMKCRKYFITENNGVFEHLKYWDFRFSNSDKYPE